MFRQLFKKVKLYTISGIFHHLDMTLILTKMSKLLLILKCKMYFAMQVIVCMNANDSLNKSGQKK